MNWWETGGAVLFGLVIGGVHYLRTTPEQRRQQRARTTRIESSRRWRCGMWIMAAAPPLVFVVGFLAGSGLALAIALGVGFALIAVGSIYLVRAIRAEPKVSHRERAEA